MLILLETMAEERRTATAPELLEPLMARLAGGDQEALAELYHRTRTSVYGLALSYLKNQHDAEDVTQDALCGPGKTPISTVPRVHRWPGC